MVASVASPSAAEGAGLQPGDVLLDLDGFVVRDAVDLRLAEESLAPGGTVHVRWRRGEAVMEGAGTVAAPRPFGPPPGPRTKPEEKK
jgi:S1-C subfamily serine protease